MTAPTLGDVPDLPLHLSIPDAGRAAYGLSRGESYAAARDGRLPTVEVSEHRSVVPTAELLRRLGVPLPAGAPEPDGEGLALLLARALRAAADVLEGEQ